MLIGKISKVQNYEAEIELFEAEGVEVKVVTESGAKGVVRGSGEVIRLESVLQGQDLKEQELITTAGQDGWPAGILIGKVGKIEKIETAIYQSAEVIKLVNVDSLGQVFVVGLPD